MRKSSAYLVALLANLWVLPNMARADDEIIVEEAHRGIPVQTAILTRRYGAVETEDEVAGEEFEAGLGATNTFQFVHWRRWHRPVGPWGWGGYWGPRYTVGFGPRFVGNPWVGSGWGWRGPAWGGPVWGVSRWRAPVVWNSGWGGGWGGPAWGGAWGPAPVTTFYAPAPIYVGGYGGCYYW